MFNKENFSKILQKINSSYETMTEFAQKADFDRTYISKYINQKLDNPPTPKILEKIANASNGVTTYTELMEMCGYIDLHTVFLQTKEKKDTNLCYWNKEDLVSIGFKRNDVEELCRLANSNLLDRSKKISTILNKYPKELLENFYNKAIKQTQLIPNSISLETILKKLVQFIEKNEDPVEKHSNDFRMASYNGIDTEGLDEQDIKEINAFVEFIKQKKKNNNK